MTDPAAAGALTPPRLALEGITKIYPSVVANDGIDIDVAPAEIHAVLGENGAGKSTLMKIIYGVVKPDSGTVRWNGAIVAPQTPADARDLGIAMVFQQFALFETLTVAENIALGLDDDGKLKHLEARLVSLSARYGLPVKPKQLIHGMSVGERQRVEILRCLMQQPQLLIMDEPTSVLTPQAVASLFDMLRKIAAEGCSILYISHKLEEIRTLCDRATILRGGRVVGHCDPRQESASSLARMMIGAEPPHATHRAVTTRGDGALIVDNLNHPAADIFGTDLVDIKLDVRGGDILGIAGIAGNGQKELLSVLSGETPVDAAEGVILNGIAAGRLDAGARRALGLAYVPEERWGHGAVPEMTLAENTLLTAHRQELVSPGGMIRTETVKAFAQATMNRFRVKASAPDAVAASLSGGNLQKFIVGREILQGPRVIIVAQPTWGVDVGATQEIRQALIDLRDQGIAVLVVSEELDELFEICDRISVIAQGRLSRSMPARGTDARTLGVMMGGSFIEQGPPSTAGELGSYLDGGS